MARVAVIVVTWNRHQAVDRLLGSLSQQTFGPSQMDVVIIDNASTDGTVDRLISKWSPERTIANRTHEAHQPAFDQADQHRSLSEANAGGFRSLTIVRNFANLGGCGGFNTGFAAVDRILGSRFGHPDFVWLVDDDADVPVNALERLVSTGLSDASIGLVGSRTVDIDDHGLTTETTIYFDAATASMAPDPVPTHPRHAEHSAWLARTGGTRGRHAFTGARDVDVVSACSLLARWSVVQSIGFWDHRYFIYCDDADWSLRCARAGHRVVCDLDAVVYHTNWLVKLTPTRAYYSMRNLVWMLEKAMPSRRARRRMLFTRLGAALLESRKALTHCRGFHAEILRRTALDIARGRGGKLDYEEPKHEPLRDAFLRVLALRPDKPLVVFCTRPGTIELAEQVRLELQRSESASSVPKAQWVYVCNEAALSGGAGASVSRDRVHVVKFESNRRSKWNAQRRFLFNPPAATVVLDNYNECPWIRSPWNIHVDQRRPGLAQVERDGLALRTRFVLRWCWAAIRAGVYALRAVKPRTLPRYG